MIRCGGLIAFAFLLLYSTIQPSTAGQVACTPTAGFNTCYRFTYSGGNQSFTVPSGVTSVETRVWGAAGGGANSSFYSNQSGGGAGGYGKGTLTVSGGQVMGIVVGQGGVVNSTSQTYGSGGAGGGSLSSNHRGASGGGYSGVFSSTSYTQANALVVAGGGGGASPGADAGNPAAGGGGGTTGGQDGNADRSGRGGTQSAGGAASTNKNCGTFAQPADGAVGNGGDGGGDGLNSGIEGGGGGGGGYFGGGGGNCQYSGNNPNGPGGGGSGFLAGSVTSASLSNGSNFPYAGGACSGTASPGGSADSQYTSGIGQGSCFSTGGNGEIVVQYHMPTVTMSVVSNGATGTFTFTGTNGYAGDSITTATPGLAVAGTQDVLTAAGTATTISVSVPVGYTFTAASCTGMGAGSMTPTYKPTPSASVQTGTLVLNTTATAAANDIACTATLNKAPTFKLQVTSIGGTASFTPSASSNLASTPGVITTVTAGTAAPVSPTAIYVTTAATDATVSIPVPTANWAMTAVSCTDANSAITGNTGTFGTVSGQVLTLPAAYSDYGANITCVATETKASVLFQKISLGGFTSFSFASNSNLASTPGSITTTAVNTATPASPTAINVSNAGTAVTVTESATTNYVLTGFTCTDANGAVTGNSGSFGSFATLTGTIPAGNVKAGSYITCVFTNSRLPTFKVQVTTIDGTGGITFSSPVNLASTPSAISTIATNTATPASPTAINMNAVSTAATLTLAPTIGLGPTSVSCTDSNAAVSGNSGSFGTVTSTLLTVPALNARAGADITCVITATQATVRVQATTAGGFGGPFTFTKSNLNSTPASATTTAINTAAPVSPTANIISAMATATTITGSPATGYYTTGGSCTDANASLTGNTGSFGSFSAGVLTLASGNVVAGSTITCVFTFTKAPTFALQVTSLASTSTFTPSASTNLASTPGAVTTVTSGTPAPVSPTVVNVTTIGTAVTLTTPAPSGYALTAVTCTDSNSGVTGNTGSFGSFAGTVLTVPSAKVVAGAAFNCILTETAASVAFQVKSLGGYTSFTFYTSNIASTPSITTTAVNTATPVSPAAVAIPTAGTDVTISNNNQGAGAWYYTSLTCTDANAAITGNTGSFGTFIGYMVTVPAANVVGGATITCVATETRVPAFTFQMQTVGGFGGPFYYSQTNLTMGLGPYTTTAANTAVPTSLTTIFSYGFGTAITVNQTAATGFALTGVTCTDSNSAVTGNTGTFISVSSTQLTIPGANVVAGADFQCMFTNTKLASLTLTEVSTGNVGGFTFTGTNGWSSQTITTVTSGTGVAGATQYLSAVSTATTISHAIPSGYTITSITCTGQGSGTYTPNTGAGTVVFDSTAVASGATLACTYRHTKTPTFKLQVTTTGGYGGAFSFTQTNLVSAPANITTTAAATATPASPSAINVSTIGTAVTITQTPPPSALLMTATCTDANSSVTGNTGSFGTFTGNVLTVPSANVVAGADFICQLTDAFANFAFQVKSLGGYGAFSYSSSNLASTPAPITTTAANTATPASPASIMISAMGTSVVITGSSGPAGVWLTTGFSCTDANAAATGNTGTFGSYTSGTVTLPAANVVAGAALTCVATASKMPNYVMQLQTLGGMGGAFTYSQTNLSGTPPSITTTAASTPSPTSGLTTLNSYNPGTAITVTQANPSGFALTAVVCTDANSGMTGNTGTFISLASNTLTIPAANNVPGADFNCQFTATKLPTLTLTMKSNGGVTGFTFTGTNGWTSQTITTVTPGTGVAGATQILSAVSTATTVTQTIPGAYQFASVSCTGLGSGTVTPTLASGAMIFNASATAAGNAIACTVTDDKTPTFKLQVSTTGGYGGPFSFAQTNLASAPGNITTTAAATATPASPTAINVSAFTTAVTVTATSPAGFDLNAVACTDANSSVTGNTGTFGSFASNVLTVASAKVVAGADFTCVLSSNKLATLTLTMKSNGGVTGFTFTGTNGWSSQTITTVTPGTGVAGATQTLSAVSTATTVTQTIPIAYQFSVLSCTGMGSGTATPTYASGAIALDALATAPGNAVACTVTDDKTPTFKVQVSTAGNFGGPFTFSAPANLASTPSSITTTAVNTATPASPTGINVTTIGTQVQLTQTPASGYTFGSVSCTDANSSVTGNTGSFGTVASNVLTVAASKVVAGADFTCALSDIKTPTFKLQVTTMGGYSGPFTFAQTNLASTPGNITTTAASTATPSSPTAINVATIGTAITVTGTGPAGFDLNAASCTDTNSSITGNTGTFGSIASGVMTLASANVVAGADFACVLTSNKLPTVTLTMKSNGSVTSFTFTGTNGWSSQTITTVTPGTGLAGATQTLTAASTASTITQGIPTGYQFSTVTCTGLGSGTVTPTYATGAMLFDASATAPGNAIACTVTDNKTPTFKLQLLTMAGFDGPFSFSQSNLAFTPANITTTSAGTATPSSPTLSKVLAIGTDVSLQQTPVAGYALTAASCTDANSAVTGNTGTFGTFAGNIVTVTAAKIVAGADITCVLTDFRSRLTLQKITLGGAGGAFTFSQTNLASTPASITTTAASTATPASPTPINVTTIGSAVTLSEAALGGWFVSAGSCTDANGAVTGNTGTLGTMSGNTLTLASANVKAGSDFTCIITDTKGAPGLTVSKTVSPTGPVAVGQTLTYTYSVTNTGNVTMTNITISDNHNGTGVFTGPYGETLTTSTSGVSNDATTNDGIWSALGPGDVVRFTATYVVSQHDVDYLQ
ncbi:beta strand repeat-containing protein [Aestuariivirga litoralis]|uniref:beta strand repeat-containing protein n=1 Tax=Aestuariivirga litoralis TaxID=2650924 RepID=UPI0018C495FD|nr:glycine-rich protein [Aestuariivirga litoralis]MBG1231174.1 hypothetical protein [Aestuariivirga litoralis]